MLIFGWGNRSRYVDSGSFPCPVCKTNTNYIHLRHRKWITFFFIPVLPISSSFESLACQKCQSSMPFEAIGGKRASAGNCLIGFRLPCIAVIACRCSKRNREKIASRR
ncbi:MAG: zinc-ribbon domain-containing protein [Pirellula sp.]